MSMASQIQGSNIRVGERVVGSKGTSGTTCEEAFIEGEKPYRYRGKVESGLVAEQADPHHGAAGGLHWAAH